MNNSKTWCDLLGHDATNCMVDGRDIIRYETDKFWSDLGGEGERERCFILWTAENHLQALAVMEAWLLELKGK